jgi:hypothetical protein
VSLPVAVWPFIAKHGQIHTIVEDVALCETDSTGVRCFVLEHYASTDVVEFTFRECITRREFADFRIAWGFSHIFSISQRGPSVAGAATLTQRSRRHCEPPHRLRRKSDIS